MSAAVESRDEWLSERRKGVGGSDIAALMGINPWKTPLDVWRDKTGRHEENRDPESLERMHWGSVLEDIVAKEYAARTGRKVQRINSILQCAMTPIAQANIDRAIVANGSRARWNGEKLLGSDRLLECKTAHALAQNGEEWGEPGTDQVPAQYHLQCQWYMGICQVYRCDLAVLFGGQRFSIYNLTFDPELFVMLIETAVEWWVAHVIRDEPPLPQSEIEARQRWARHQDGKQIEVDSDIAEAINDLIVIKAEIKSLQDTEKSLKDMIFPALEDAETIFYQGRKLATYKANKDSTKTDWKSLAEYLGPADDSLIGQYSRTTPGARTFRIMKEKKQ